MPPAPSRVRSGIVAKLTIAGVVAVGAAGCGPQPPPPGVSTPFPPLVLLPEPGATNLLAAGDRGYRQRCQGQAPSLTLDAADVEPPRVPAGAAVNHRLVYTYCANPGGQAIPGTLTTVIRQGGRTVAGDSNPDVRLAPGQWALNTRIVVPPGATPGTYQIDSRFSGAASFQRSVGFEVE